MKILHCKMTAAFLGVVLAFQCWGISSGMPKSSLNNIKLAITEKTLFLTGTLINNKKYGYTTINVYGQLADGTVLSFSDNSNFCAGGGTAFAGAGSAAVNLTATLTTYQIDQVSSNGLGAFGQHYHFNSMTEATSYVPPASPSPTAATSYGLLQLSVIAAN